MDSFGAFAHGDWESINRMFSSSTDLEFDFTQQFLAQQVSDHRDEGLQFSFITPGPGVNNQEGLFFSPSDSHDDHHHQMISGSDNQHLDISQDSSSFNSNACSASFFTLPTSSSHETVYESLIGDIIPVTNAGSTPMDVEDKIDLPFPDVQPAASAVPANETRPTRKFQAPAAAAEDRDSKKKPRVTSDNSKKKQNHNGTSLDDQRMMIDGTGSDWQSSASTCNSEDETASQETNNGIAEPTAPLSLTGKPRATRGSATDPQSLYARKRREKINERLKILQNLVPNGTKVDISTMLEEAVNYVKFMQLQIKLLSSDDLWMFAPLAYNGIDLSLNERISTFL